MGLFITILSNIRHISKILPNEDMANNQHSDLFFLGFDNKLLLRAEIILILHHAYSTFHHAFDLSSFNATFSLTCFNHFFLMASSVGSWVKTSKSYTIMIVITKLVLEGKRDTDSRDAGGGI
jgi:hypothetical protein